MEHTGEVMYNNTSGLISKDRVSKDQSYDYQAKDKVEVLVKTLGTMVLMSEYSTSNLEIGKKEYVGNIQMPILTGSNRDIVINKLIELINKL